MRPRVFRILLWRVELRRGGQATPWPWTEIVVCRRKARRGVTGVEP